VQRTLQAHKPHGPSQKNLARLLWWNTNPVRVATSPNVLIVHAGFSGNTVADFVKQAGQQAGRWNYGSLGAGSAS